MLKVTTFCCNEDTDPFYMLATADEGQVLYTQPSYGWKTKSGAIRWAIKRGYEYVEEEEANKNRPYNFVPM